MRVFLTLLKWAFWLAALLLVGLVLLIKLINGPGDIADLLLALFYCSVAAFPGVLVHLAQKRLCDD
jgi:hypothetical protein